MEEAQLITKEAFSDRYGVSCIPLPASRNHFSPINCIKCGEYRAFSYYRGVYINNPGGTPVIQLDHACIYCFDEEEETINQ